MRRVTYSNVVSTLALVVAVGTGGAFAASQIDGSTLENRSVPAKKLRKKTITRKEIRQATLRTLVQGGGSYRSGHLTGEAGGFPGSGGLVQSTRTPLGLFSMSCGAASAEARYRNTTAGPADVFRSAVGSDTSTTFQTVPRNGTVAFAATETTGPEQVDLRAGKGTQLDILRVGLSRIGTHCAFDYEFVSSE